MRSLQPFDRPRERLEREGPQGLTDADLLAILIGVGMQGADAGAIASMLLGCFSDLRSMARAGVGELAAVPGLGHAKACRLKAALALAGRLAERPFDRGEPVLHARQVYERVGRRTALLDHEVFIALALDSQNRILTELTLSRGGACSLEFRPADVFRALLGAGAIQAILVHNHPSGLPDPSTSDLRSTERLTEVGELLGLRVLDHIIVGRSSFWSTSAGTKVDVEPTTE
jgi:DNA repair protein RadC